MGRLKSEQVNCSISFTLKMRCRTITSSGHVGGERESCPREKTDTERYERPNSTASRSVSTTTPFGRVSYRGKYPAPDEARPYGSLRIETVVQPASSFMVEGCFSRQQEICQWHNLKRGHSVIGKRGASMATSHHQAPTAPLNQSSLS